MSEENTPKSGFTGGAFANFFIGLAVGFVTIITIGLAGPFMQCWRRRWECRHTFYDGKQLAFNGTGLQLFGIYIKVVLLSWITLGIYYWLCGSVVMMKWYTKHTQFVGETAESNFDGTWYELFAVNFLTTFITIITLGLGSFWAHCFMCRWECKHQTISTHKLTFDGTAWQYFGTCIKWILLTIITLGIYSFWRVVKEMNWTCKHIHLQTQA